MYHSTNARIVHVSESGDLLQQEYHDFVPTMSILLLHVMLGSRILTTALSTVQTWIALKLSAGKWRSE